ncbi:hypothetical protein RB195_014975 [Necator americanus]|uniref:Uncharacterized protein n=1 Tax=Necator americanus TaxID=51031 RepID=A0ABR1E2F1_NECAM
MDPCSLGTVNVTSNGHQALDCYPELMFNLKPPYQEDGAPIHKARGLVDFESKTLLKTSSLCGFFKKVFEKGWDELERYSYVSQSMASRNASRPVSIKGGSEEGDIAETLATNKGL